MRERVRRIRRMQDSRRPERPVTTCPYEGQCPYATREASASGKRKVESSLVIVCPVLLSILKVYLASPLFPTLLTVYYNTHTHTHTSTRTNTQSPTQSRSVRLRRLRNATSNLPTKRYPAEPGLAPIYDSNYWWSSSSPSTPERHPNIFSVAGRRAKLLPRARWLAYSRR